jgi:hypothetical protein
MKNERVEEDEWGGSKMRELTSMKKIMHKK